MQDALKSCSSSISPRSEPRGQFFISLGGQFLTSPDILDWMSLLGGNDILKSFGIYTEVTKIADGRRTVIQQMPQLLELLRQAKEYEIDDGYTFVECNEFSDAPLFQSEIKGISDEALSVWHRATGRTIVHVDGGATTHYTACKDHIGFGISPNATEWVSALAIDDGKAARLDMS
jgi:hypothetical protein